LVLLSFYSKGPCEEGLKLVPAGTFINLNQFHIFEQDIIFIDCDESPEFEFCKKTLENSEIIGLDTEFQPIYTKLDSGKGAAII
jgi:hypothetical protein